METLAVDRLEAARDAHLRRPPRARRDAAWVARLLVRANLRGHDSHGVIRIPQYVGSIRKGETNPRPAMQVLQETPTTAILDGDLGLGQVVARRAAEVALDKAARQGIAAVGIRRSNHIGRLAITSSWPPSAGSSGSSGRTRRRRPSVVPYGGTEPAPLHEPPRGGGPGPGRRRRDLRRHGDQHRGRGQGPREAEPQGAPAGRLGDRSRRAAPSPTPRASTGRRARGSCRPAATRGRRSA